MPSDPYAARPHGRSRAYLLILTVVALIVALAAAMALARDREPDRAGGAGWISPSASAAPSPMGKSASTALRAVAPPADLPVISYAKGPRGLPADPDPESTVVPTEALWPEKKMALYDAPGGKPRAFLPPRISGLPVVAPIVARQAGWVAVLPPSANRKIGWLPQAGWRPAPLRDHLVVDLEAHRLTWLREGEEQQQWTVATGTRATPTPRGRTFVMGKTGTSGEVYAGLDALVLASLPENPEKLSAGLQGAHTGIHAWSQSSAFGRSVSNGCVRMPPTAQRTLLKEIDPGTPVIVLG